jgi:RNA polymerase sigma factor (TIGR02999 family)
MSDVTHILAALDAGDPHAAAQLLPLVYEELRRLAAAQMAGEKPGQTLNATALVHEAYLRLVASVEPSGRRGQEDTSGLRLDARPDGRQFADRRHFFRVAAEAMRRVLIDRARQRRRVRHGGGRERVPLSDIEPAADAPDDELLALNEALDRFAARDPVKAELVKLRYFAGLSEAEAAEALGLSRATASRYWAFARAWLIDALDGK